MTNKIAVLLWLYHTDLWDEFYSKLYPIREHIHLMLGLEDTQFNINNKILNQANSSFPSLNISFYPNRGGDILPFINQISQLAENYKIFLKLHSKKSMLFKYVNWRSVLLQSYIGDENQFLRNISQFNNPKIGSVCNRPLLIKNHEHTNTKKINELCNILNIDYNIYGNGTFCAGSMFFGQTKIFQKYFNSSSLPVLEKLLKEEQGHVDDKKEGKYCHSLERIFGYLVKASSLNVGYCIEDTIKILNPLATNKKLHIIILDNNECYVQEDIHVYGYILNETPDYTSIKWVHLSDHVVRKYKKINQKTLIKYE